ncbi:hypothetical protein LIER_32404 [Lithospermum erythrorhizon]|uniref:Uncharacterized protein n=1 Tax=Lithospermum erythrorhizon TaxID=34254 RepID=A0AAV3RZ46_LITER
MSFTDRVDVVPLPKGFVLPQFTQFGDSRNSRKTYARREVYSIGDTTARKEENISFNDKDLVGIEFPHDDPVVIA